MTIIGDQEQFVIKGRQLLLTCQYDALPPVSAVKWEKDGIVIARNASVEINDSLLTIPHYNESQVQLEITATETQDAGRYTCLVNNDIGDSSNTTSVVIQGVFCWCIVLTLVFNFSSYQLRVLLWFFLN